MQRLNKDRNRPRGRRTAQSLVPGIERYPDLLQRMNRDLDSLPSGCSDCDLDNLTEQYRSRVEGRSRVEQYSVRKTGPS